MSYPFLIGSQLSTGSPLYSIGNNGFPLCFLRKPCDFPQILQFQLKQISMLSMKNSKVFLIAQPHFHAHLVT